MGALAPTIITTDTHLLIIEVQEIIFVMDTNPAGSEVNGFDLYVLGNLFT